MIIKARARAGGSQLAAYLLNREGNERAEILEMRGLDCFGGNLKNSLIGLEIEGKAAACKTPLYHVSFRLEEGAELTPEQWREAADRLEKNLHLDDHPRALVMHEEGGEKHLHVVWSRLDDRTLQPTRLSNDWHICKATARELEKDFHTRELSNEHTQEHPTRADYEQAKRQGRDIGEIKAEIKAAYERSDNGAALENALADAGYILAKGDKRDFVAVDKTGQEYTIGKRLTGATAAQIRTKTADLDRDLLPTVDQAKDYQQQREQARAEREREEKQRAELRAIRAEIERRAAESKAARTIEQHQQQQPAKAEKEHSQNAPEPAPKTQENTPAPPQVLTPEQVKAAQEHAKTPEAKEAAKEAARAANRTAQLAALKESFDKTKTADDFLQALDEKDFVIAEKGKGGFAAVHISGMVYKINQENLGEAGEKINALLSGKLFSVSEKVIFESVDKAKEILPEWRKEANEKRAEERNQAAATRAAEKRDEADARAKEKGHKGILESREVIREAKRISETTKEFDKLLKLSGLELVNSGKEYRPYAIVDHKGRTLDLSYTLGETAKATKEALKDLDPATLRTAQQVQAEVKAQAKEITQATKEGERWQESHAVAAQAKENAKPPNIAPEKPKEAAPNVGRAAGAIGDSLLNLAGSLLGGIAGPVTHEQIRQQAAGTQQRTAEQVQDAAQQFKQPLTPQEREAKAREFDRAAAEATRARDAYKAAHANARGDERSRIRRAEYRANIEAREAAQQAALLRETEQQKQEREAKEREEREAERRRRERQRER